MIDKMKKSKSRFVKIEEFNKKTMLNEKLGLDIRDNIILSLISKDPNISILITWASRSRHRAAIR